MKALVNFLIPGFLFFNLVCCSESATKPPPPDPVEQHDTITVNIEQVTHRSVSLRLNHKLQNPNDNYVLNRITTGDTSSFLILNS